MEINVKKEEKNSDKEESRVIDVAIGGNATNVKHDENVKREKEFQTLWGQFEKVVNQRFARARQMLTISETLNNANVEGINYLRLKELQQKHTVLCDNQKGIIISPEDIQCLHLLIDMVGALTTAYSDCIKIDDAFTRHPKDSVSSAVEVMDRKAYSHVPIIDKDKKLVGVFSDSTRSELLRMEMGIVGDMTFEDIEKLVVLEAYRHLAAYSNEKFLFVAENTPRSGLQKLAGSPKTQDDMIFVTEHGDSSEPILGILTVRDIRDLSSPPQK